MRHPTPRSAATRPLALLLVFLLSACGGGGGGSEPPPADSVLTPANRWSGAIPDTAVPVSADELRDAVASGRWTLAGPNTDAAQTAERQRELESAIAYLRASAADNPAAQELLARLAAATDPLADLATTVPGIDHPVALLGPTAALQSLAAAHRRTMQADNALSIYRGLYAVLPDELRAQLPGPDSLAGQALDAVNAARAEADARLAAWSAANGPAGRTQPLAAPADVAGRLRALALQPGQGSDKDGNCAPRNLAARHWFALKSFLPAVKQQGFRNTCWAFAAVASMEIRERVQSDRKIDLSEQFLINKVRHDWFPNDTVESGSAFTVLNAALARGQMIPAESVWTYNPSLRRTSIKEFIGLCNPYGTGPNKGSCSDSAHQSPVYCADWQAGRYCAYETVGHVGAGAAASPVSTLWVRGQSFDLATYVHLLSSGVPLLGSMQVHPGFENVATKGALSGVVTDFSTLKFNPATLENESTSRGQHEVLIVGFLGNDQLASIGAPSDVPGGGYFIVRNSWGCGYGDEGYAYLPAQYVQFVFDAIDVPQFDAVRSSAWTLEQRAPGSDDPLSVFRTTEIATADLRLEKNLASLVSVLHPVARSVRVEIRSDVEGVLYDGPWITDRGALIGTRVPHTFNSTGRHLLGITGFYGDQSVRVGVAVDVLNTAPTLRLLASGDARQGEPFAIAAQAADLNETDATGLCTRARWTVTAPDTLSGTSGCNQSVTFNATGTRTVSVSTTDTEGLAVTTLLNVNVLPPAANPYPRISAARVLSRQPAGLFNACLDVAVADGQTIDLRERGCIGSTGETAPLRFTASVDVENPTSEALGYEWNLFTSTAGVESDLYGGPITPGTATVTLFSPGNQSLVTKDCRLTVTVRAPQPERTKSRTVWSGRCTFEVGRVG